MWFVYFSLSSALIFSTLVLGRSETGGPRALINVGRALVFPPAAAAPAVAADVPFSLPLVDAPVLPVAGWFEPAFFGFFLNLQKKQNSKRRWSANSYCNSASFNNKRSCSNRAFSSLFRCSLKTKRRKL